MNPNQGGHTSIPIFGVPIPETQQNYLDGKPQKADLLAITSEETINDCFGQPWKNPSLLDITDDRAPVADRDARLSASFRGISAPRARGSGCTSSTARSTRPITASCVIVAMFNAGLQVWDIRDPFNPRRVAYFIQAPNKNTKENCGTYQGNTKYCRKAIFSDLGEVDDRGYIYNFDRAGSGLTILQLTGDAAKVASGQGQQGQKQP